MELIIMFGAIFVLCFGVVLYLSFRKEQKESEAMLAQLEKRKDELFQQKLDLQRGDIRALKEKLQAQQQNTTQHDQQNRQHAAEFQTNAAAATSIIAAAAVANTFEEERDEPYEDYEQYEEYETDAYDYYDDEEDNFEPDVASSYTSYEDENHLQDDFDDGYVLHDPYTNPGVDLVVDKGYHGIDHSGSDW